MLTRTACTPASLGLHTCTPASPHTCESGPCSAWDSRSAHLHTCEPTHLRVWAVLRLGQQVCCDVGWVGSGVGHHQHLRRPGRHVDGHLHSRGASQACLWTPAHMWCKPGRSTQSVRWADAHEHQHLHAGAVSMPLLGGRQRAHGRTHQHCSRAFPVDTRRWKPSLALHVCLLHSHDRGTSSNTL